MRLRRDGRPDGRSKHATFERWLREHTPLVHIGLYGAGDELAIAAERRRRRELEELARVRREALAYCVECHNPLLATEDGFQFCPYERADRAAAPSFGQHAKVKAAVHKAKLVVVKSAVAQGPPVEPRYARKS
jgi:hypothetical protein